MDELNVLYEDEYFLALDKPAGMISQSGNGSLSELAQKYREEKGEDPYIGVVHRLDRATRGVIVYAKTQRAAAAVSSLIQNGEFKKTYEALAEGVLEPESGEMEDLLFFDRKRNKSFVVGSERKGTRRAGLSYETLAVSQKDGAEFSKVRIKLYTGRTHQIRVQFASRRHPIAGDRTYGGKTKLSSIALVSKSVSFIHPFTNEAITITSRYEPDL